MTLESLEHYAEGRHYVHAWPQLGLEIAIQSRQNGDMTSFLEILDFFNGDMTASLKSLIDRNFQAQA